MNFIIVRYWRIQVCKQFLRRNLRLVVFSLTDLTKDVAEQTSDASGQRKPTKPVEPLEIPALVFTLSDFRVDLSYRVQFSFC